MFVEQLTDNQFAEILNMISDDGEVIDFTINKLSSFIFTGEFL